MVEQIFECLLCTRHHCARPYDYHEQEGPNTLCLRQIVTSVMKAVKQRYAGRPLLPGWPSKPLVKGSLSWNSLSDKDPVQQEGRGETGVLPGKEELFNRLRDCEVARIWGVGGVEEVSSGTVIQSCAPRLWPWSQLYCWESGPPMGQLQINMWKADDGTSSKVVLWIIKRKCNNLLGVFFLLLLHVLLNSS